jgi:flagellar biosynthesis activator protein FlaF
MKGYAAYGRVQNTTEGPRQIEFRLLAQVTTALRAAQAQPNDRPNFYKALVWNKKVWDAFMVDLVDDRNQLPKDIRQSLIKLSAWVSRQTFAVMDGNAGIDALIEVNSNIMDGLK